MNTCATTRNLFLWLVISLASPGLYAQSATEQKTLQTALEQKSFACRVKSMTAMKGGTRMLNPGYFINVSGDTLTVNLPYVGRVYTPSIGEEGGFNFTAYQFEYKIKPGKKSGWNVTIKTTDQPKRRQFTLNISADGSSSLTVVSSDRESISYSGTIDTRKD